VSVSVPLLLDIGNILFFTASLPQLYQTYQRRHELRDLSIMSWVMQIFASIAFLAAGLLSGAWFAVILNAFNMTYAGITVYWIHRTR
jgi:uncharacterized protein with PQ loop repeat